MKLFLFFCFVFFQVQSSFSSSLYNESSCCTLDTFFIEQYHSYLLQKINNSYHPVVVNESEEGIGRFAGFHNESLAINATSYDNYTLITNPNGCVTGFKPAFVELLSEDLLELFRYGSNHSLFVRTKDLDGKPRYSLMDSSEYSVLESFDMLYIDCKASAEKNIKQIGMEFEKPTIDIEKIRNSGGMKSVTFFYTSSFENNSPQSYTELFQYTESKEISVSLQSSVLDEAVSSSSWMNSEMKESNWEANGNVGFNMLGFSIGGGGGGGGRSSSTDEKSGSQSHSHTTQSSDGRTQTHSLSVTKTGSITVEPFSRAKVVGAHHDIKNTTFDNVVWIKLGTNRYSKYYTGERICEMIRRTGIAGNIEVVDDHRPGLCYLRIEIKMRVDMGTDNDITIEGSPIFFDEIDGKSNGWYKAITDVSKEVNAIGTGSIVAIVLSVLVSMVGSYFIGVYVTKKRLGVRTNQNEMSEVTDRLLPNDSYRRIS